MVDKTCPNVECYQYNQAYSTFNYCSSCGKELVEIPNCKCGFDVGMMRYCPKCGTKNERRKDDAK